ncbi:MAG: formylglycine-generating enzyme family protein [Bacteroidota bacterium]|nr:formylglycine-generating enzyme family protein [Bacteroidota bacterium]
MALIRSGKYIPMYGRDNVEIEIKSFMLDVYPVTNEQFLAFVKSNPKWRKSKIKTLFGDVNYLRSWKNDTTFGDGQSPGSPVTNISWYAAKAFCDCQGKRLPTIDEWEYVAMADEKQTDARKSEAYTQYILDWYEKSNTFKNQIGSTYKNYWGVYDMHGLVWEWTSDFNSVLMENDSREDKSSSNNLFCGGASIDASDLRNYAAFMRYAFRGSLKASYSVQNLGFRCAKDIQY